MIWSSSSSSCSSCSSTRCISVIAEVDVVVVEVVGVLVAAAEVVVVDTWTQAGAIWSYCAQRTVPPSTSSVSLDLCRIYC